MNLKRILFVILIFVFAFTTVARDKTVMLGKISWYTEKTPWEELLSISKKANKPLLVVFGAEWLDISEDLKKSLFSNNDFKKITKLVIPVYIEQASKEGDVYCRTNNVRIFPTYKIFSSSGEMMDNGTPSRTVEGFTKWVKEVISGNNALEISKKLEKNPNDRELIYKLVLRMGMSDKREKLTYLRKAVRLNPDYKDPLSQKIYEKLAVTIAENIPGRNGREEFLKENTQTLVDIYNAYAPDKFKYEMRGNIGLVTLLNWYLQLNDNQKVLSLFNDFLKRKGNSFNLRNDIEVVGWAVSAYLNMDNVPEAEKWITRTKNTLKPEPKLDKDEKILYYYPGMYRNIIAYMDMREKRQEVEKYVLQFYDEMKRLKLNRIKEEIFLEFAETYPSLKNKAK